MNKRCRDCGGECCNGSRFDSVILYKGEIKRLKALGAKIIKCGPNSEMDVKGGCIFLKDGRCSIYKQRPSSCAEFTNSVHRLALITIVAQIGKNLLTFYRISDRVFT